MLRIVEVASITEKQAVFDLRHHVFVTESGRYASRALERELVDVWDTADGVAILTAYARDEMVGTLRINTDTAIGLPAERHVDLAEVRENIGREARIAGVSMLAVKKAWRHRGRTVFRLFGAAAEIMACVGTTHIITAVSAETISLYARMGFQSAGRAVWIHAIGDYLVPIYAPFEAAAGWHRDVSARRE